MRLLWFFCFLSASAFSQVIKLQTAGGASAVVSSNGTVTQMSSFGTIVSQGASQANQSGLLFGVLDFRPALQASSVVYSGLSPTQHTLSWSNGNGARRIVVARAGSPVNASVASKTFYAPNAAFGSGTEIAPGNFVVYEGTGNSVTVTGLNPSVVYHFKVFEYNGRYGTNNANIEYQTDDNTGNPSSRTTLALSPTQAATALSFNNRTKNQNTLLWTNGNGSGRLVVVREGNPVNQLPANGEVYQSNAVFGSGTDLGASNFVVFSASTNQVSVTGLKPNTVYHYQVVEFNGTGADNHFFSISAPSISQLTLTEEPVAKDETSVTQNSFAANWEEVAGAMDYFLDVATDASFTNLLTGFADKKISGTLSSVVSGLQPGTSYFYRLRAANAAGQSANSASVEVLTIPATPTITASTNITATSFTANWSASQSATEYLVDVASDQAFTQFVPNFSGRSVSTNSVMVTGLTGGTSYFIRIRAKNSSGTSPNPSSGFSQITRPVPPELLPTAQVDVGTDFFKVTWRAVVGASSYDIYVEDEQLSSIVSGYPRSVNHPQLSTNASGLKPNTFYRFYVRARNAAGDSEKSNIEPTKTKSTDPNDDDSPTISIITAETTSSIIRAQISKGRRDFKVVFAHRKITAPNFDIEPTVVLSTDNPKFSQTVNPDWYDELGMEYYIKVTDLVNREVTTPNIFVYRTLSVPNIPGFESNFTGDPSGYRMFSIPVDIKNDNDIKTVFRSVFSQFSGYNKEKWRLFHYPGGIDAEYLENEVDLFKFETGKSYWFNAVEAIKPIELAGGVLAASQAAPFKVTVKRGWNQIGNPYPFNVSWSAIKAHAPNSTLGLKSLFQFSGTGYTKSSDVLRAWGGAFIYSQIDGELQIPVTARTQSSGRSMAEQDWLQDKQGWRLELDLNYDGMTQASSIGMHPLASMGFDAFDEPVIPRFVNYLELKSVAADRTPRSLSEDVVSPQRHYTWNISLVSNIEGKKAMLSWNKPTQVTGALMLYDVEGQKLIDLKTVDQYQFTYAGERKLKIIYSFDSKFDPGVTAIGDAYPNPFIDKISIPVLVDVPNQSVTISIYDAVGKKIKTIDSVFDKPGAYTVTWDGKCNDNSEATQGMLMYQVVGSSGMNAAFKKIVKAR